ncbi:MAG TPA: hypothetical protein VFR48_06050 [Solirubrobacteraceae bacterium]|nr:hypothetical protein [Solirubrobacteraceae bacterium]
MKKTGVLVVGMVLATAALAALALAAGAQPIARASACVFGKEARGCKLNGTGYGDFKSHLIVGFPSSSKAELSIPVSQICPQVSEEVSIFANGKGAVKIGSSIKFSGKAAIKSETTTAPVSSSMVKSAKVTATLTLTNAKAAKLSGKAEVTLQSGAKCSKKLPSKLSRILGG